MSLSFCRSAAAAEDVVPEEDEAADGVASADLAFCDAGAVVVAAALSNFRFGAIE